MEQDYYKKYNNFVIYNNLVPFIFSVGVIIPILKLEK